MKSLKSYIQETQDDRIKLVVIDDHTLGYILPERPNSAQILHSSILKGSLGLDSGSSVNLKNRKVRLASEKDFDDFRVLFTPQGFGNSKEYIFEK